MDELQQVDTPEVIYNQPAVICRGFYRGIDHASSQNRRKQPTLF